MPDPPTHAPLPERLDLLVVGGGPAGLTAAWRAAASGHRTALVERSPRLGGMAASITVAGQRVDLGSHRLHPAASPRVLDLLHGLLGDDLQVRRRNGRIRLGDRWIAFPLRTEDLVLHTPRAFATRAAVDAVTAPVRRRRSRGEDTFADVVRNRLGPAVLEHFYGPYARKLWGEEPERLSPDLARRRISATGATDIVGRLRRSRSAEGHTFLSPRQGYGQIVDRLADAAREAGVQFAQRTTVSAIGPRTDDGRGVSATLSDGSVVLAGRVLWTAPLGALVGASPDAPEEIRTAARGLRHRGMALVYLVVPRSRYTTYDAHYVPSPHVTLTRLSEPKNYRDGDDPPNRTVLCAEIPCRPGDDTWRATDKELGTRVERELAMLDLPAPRAVASIAHRLASVYPVLDLDGDAAMREVLGWAEQLPGVTVLGRQGTHVVDNLHHVLDMALDAVDALGADGHWDDAAWRASRARHAAHVVED